MTCQLGTSSGVHVCQREVSIRALQTASKHAKRLNPNTRSPRKHCLTIWDKIAEPVPGSGYQGHARAGRGT